MDTIRIGICDDDKHALPQMEAQIREVLKNYSDQVEATISTFDVAEDFYKSCKETAFDLVFLDIEMPEHNGFDLAMDIRPFCLETYLVYVSSHENHVYDSFHYNARNFIRKSYFDKDIKRTLEKYMEVTARKRITYRVSDGFGKEDVLIKDIYYIECNVHDVMIKTNTKEYHMYGSLKRMEKELSGYDFIRTHRNYLVNKMYIKNVGSRKVELKDGSMVDMSREQKKKVLEEMKQYDRRI